MPYRLAIAHRYVIKSNAVSYSKLGYKDSNLEMLESESSALPFGDSPLFRVSRLSVTTKTIIYHSFSNCKYFFYFFNFF